jgi:glycerol-3-phosphate cytidylyltransferase
MNDKIVLTVGTFDLVHAGHINFLRQCASLGKVTVSLNTDDFVEKYKGHSPLLSYSKREALVKRVEYVSRVVPNIGGPDSKKIIELIQPDILAIGTDWAKKDYYTQMQFTQEWLDENGILLVYLPYTENISSSKIKELCLSQK